MRRNLGTSSLCTGRSTEPYDSQTAGKQYFASHWKKQHTDRVLDIDDCIAIDQVYGRYIQLIEGNFFGNCWENTYLTI